MEIDMAVVANAPTYDYQFQQAKHTRNGRRQIPEGCQGSQGNEGSEACEVFPFAGHMTRAQRETGTLHLQVAWDSIPAALSRVGFPSYSPRCFRASAISQQVYASLYEIFSAVAFHRAL